MKKITFITVAFALFLSCSKDDDKQQPEPTPQEILLSATYNDGKPEWKYEYDSEGRLTQAVAYNSAGTAPAIMMKLNYDDKGFIDNHTVYSMPGEVPSSRSIYTCDEQGRMTSATQFDLSGVSPHTPIASVAITYNAKGLASKFVYKDEDDEFAGQTNFAYYDDNNVKSVEAYKTNGAGALWLASKTTTSVTDGFQSKGLQRIRAVLGPEVSLSLSSESIQSFRYSQVGVIISQTSSIMSARELNTDGSIKRQTVTTKLITPAGADVVNGKTYEYILR